MGLPVKQEYFNRKTAQVAGFVDELKEHAAPGGTFDSAAAGDFLSTVTNRSAGSVGVAVPEKLGVLLDEFGDEDGKRVTRAILDGCNIYREEHGCEAPGDLLEQAIHLAYATTESARRRYSLDSANSLHQDNWSLQPNRAVIAILSIMGDAIPFAHYLPTDIASNESILAIMSHQAGNDYGGYAAGGLLDAGFSGSSYIGNSRVHALFPAVTTGNITGALTTIQATDETCSGGSAVKLVRGTSLVYVNGQVVAKEIDTAGSGNSTVSGSVTIGATTYQIGGTINTDTGAFAITSTPALATTVPVAVEGFIDYERAPELTPSIISAVNTYRIRASAWRVTTQQTMDARTQMANELGLDPYSEAVIAIQAQFANERHFQALRYGRRLAVNNQPADYDFQWSTRSVQMNRALIWEDFGAKLGLMSQQMALDTMNHGITHLYVGKNLASQFRSLPRDIFEPSGVYARPAVYRIGKLFGEYDVYYTPKGVSETGVTAAQVLAVGRATDVTRNPVILGDAVPPTVIPLSVGTDLKTGAGFYARNFTCVNPHAPSALGFATINVTNLT